MKDRSLVRHIVIHQRIFDMWKYLLLLLLFGCNEKKANIPTVKETTIVLLPYEGFDTSLIPFIQRQIDSFYHCKVICLTSAQLPSFAYYKPRNRYKADSLLKFENRFLKDNEIIVGLTGKDISTKKDSIGDWGILGYGACPGSVCIVSTYRLLSSPALFKERFIKIILHEIGHNFGLPHCSNNVACLMNDAEGSINTVDKEKKWLCDKCRKQISL
ncbi:archaemetzincin [Ferruginibacter albus]|uniref:archaemetzincin n=1 Tax=Ferruginibacter albus TaxID=2875540 RepID=UPI001CC3834B|nr:archaemetzincin [Ferruginibacter albus]UAY51775.1 hypothetical protein K9M53_14415 [Ferruginibacter albus]